MSMCNMEQGTKTSSAVEVWKDIEGYEGLYQVSNLGLVRSLDHIEENLWKGKPYKRMHLGRTLKPIKQVTGYYSVTLHKCGEQQTTRLHRLVAKAFVPNPDNLPEVNHKDENKANNRADNLEWCDGVYNTNYGTGKYRKTAKRMRKVEQLTADGQHIAYFDAVRIASRATGCSVGHIQESIKKGWLTHGYRWRYVEP